MRIGRSVLILSFLFFGAARAETPSSDAVRSKNVRFDDAVVEGINQNSKDSLDTVGKRDGAEKAHLYNKRQSFKPEIQSLSKELGQLP